MLEQNNQEVVDSQPVVEEVSQPSSQQEDTGAETPESHNEPETVEEDGGGEGDVDGNTNDEEPSYTPNTKFKVDGKELEFDDKIKSVLTKENEPIIRELVEKAHGIDAIKARHEEVKQQRDNVAEHYQGLAGRVREFAGQIQSGDLDSFFEGVGIPFERLADWMARKLKTQEELPEAHRGLYDENRAYKNRLKDSETQIQNLQEQFNQTMVHARSTELDTAIANDSVRGIASEYDERLGEPGGFRRAVIAHAAATENATGKPIDTTQAISNFLRVLGRTPGTAKSAAPAQPSKKIVQPSTAKTIPNVGASAIAPTGRKPKSIDELKQMSKEFDAR